VRFKEVVYVLHAFTGIKTALHDVDLVAQRLKIAQRDYEARHGKAKR
jgi:phage-related protein